MPRLDKMGIELTEGLIIFQMFCIELNTIFMSSVLCIIAIIINLSALFYEKLSTRCS